MEVLSPVQMPTRPGYHKVQTDPESRLRVQLFGVVLVEVRVQSEMHDMRDDHAAGSVKVDVRAAQAFALRVEVVGKLFRWDYVDT